MPETDPQSVVQTHSDLSLLSHSFKASEKLPWRRFYFRLVQLTTLLCVELLAISIWLDAGDLKAPGLISWVRRFGPWLVRILVASGFFSIFFAGSRLESRALPFNLLTARPRWRFLGGHGAALVLFAGLSRLLFEGHADATLQNIVALGWLATGLLAMALAFLAFVPATMWLNLARQNLDVCIFALCAGCLAYLLGNASRALWTPLCRATFAAVQILLRPFLSGLISSPSALVIGTPRFLVEIAPECSGYEGIGLVVAFCSAWLWFLRREWRFPRALLLVPAGAILIWLSNAARIAVLIVIGNAGARSLALGGFHSQAGWIAFIVITLGLCLSARRIAWLNRSTPAASNSWHGALSGVATPYLLPVLAMLTASLISRGLAGNFEYFEPLRLVAGAAVLWLFRRHYARLNWQFSGAALIIGGLAFLLWTALSSRGATNGTISAQEGLVGFEWGFRIFWTSCRLLSAVLIAPAAEELAYREYLLLRLNSREPSPAAWNNVPWLTLFFSSLAYGALQGDQWIAGTAAGLLFGLAFLLRCRIGDAFAAHSVANLLVIVWMLLGHAGRILS